MTDEPKKIVSERGVPLDETEVPAEVVDAEVEWEQDPPEAPKADERDPSLPCLYCQQKYHPNKSTEPDKYGLYCPGENANKGELQKYLMFREFAMDQEKVDDLDVDQLQKDAQAAYDGRKRSDVTIQELQADINMRLGRLRPKMKLRENLPSDGPEFEIPHVTVPGRVPGGYKPTIEVAPKGGKRPSKILTQRQQQAEKARNSRIVQAAANEVPTFDEMPKASEVPKDRRQQEYDQMMFIDPHKNGG